MKQARAKNMEAVMEQQIKQKYRYKDNEEFAGAIQRNKYVMALKRDNKSWRLAQILEIRYKLEPNSDEEPEDEDETQADRNSEEEKKE